MNVIRYILAVIDPVLRNLKPLPPQRPCTILTTVIIGIVAVPIIIQLTVCQPACTHHAAGIKAIVLSIDLIPAVHDNISIIQGIIPVIVVGISGIKTADHKPFIPFHHAVFSQITSVTAGQCDPTFPVIIAIHVKIVGFSVNVMIAVLQDCTGGLGVIPAFRHNLSSSIYIFNLKPAVIL